MSSADGVPAPSSSTRILHFLHVPWPPQVESIAIPFQLAASNRVTPCGTRTRRAPGSKTRSTRTGAPGCSAGPVSVAAGLASSALVTAQPGRGSRGRRNRGRRAAAACWARCAAIQDAPQGSRSSSRSAALTARTICGARASMMALVRPCEIATGRNAAPIACRSGMPNDTFEAPSVMFTPNSSRSSAIVSSVRIPCPVSAPTGMASGSITMSSIAIPYLPVATSMSLRASSTRRPRLLRDLLLVVGQADDRGAVLACTSGRIAASRSSSAVTELTSALPW